MTLDEETRRDIVEAKEALECAEARWYLDLPGAIGNQLTSDFKYVANNTAGDVIDVVTAPLHLKQVPEVLSSPKVLSGARGCADFTGWIVRARPTDAKSFAQHVVQRCRRTSG